ncbi:MULTISPECIES: hypothetical protein [unclassified Solwaraspora]|uniref:hypothetical protein n=1 Tax=unclassified Solwaraspora TaxID=2627926 RepID=UPI00259B7522|nr:hypothetical protein [Solwaraspora sp. WMMA2056]WJK41156.1 hypothetical protein O7608_01460 [Solwaraspora sp. WMMA2056]
MPYRNDKPDRFTRPPLPAKLINERPAPDRPPLPKRVPGDTDVDADPRFHLVGARGVAPAPPDNPVTVAQLAKRMAQRHMPDRMGGCRHCGRTYCDLFLEALAVLDRRDQAAARQIRAVLQYAGLTPPARDDDDSAHPSP